MASCGGVTETSGLGEPIFIESGASFVRGTLPGTAPSTSATASIPTTGAQVLDIETPSTLLTEGQVGHTFSGHTSTSAYSIGVRIQGQGSGYWLLQAGGPDPTQNNDLTFQFNADIGYGLTTGNVNVLFVAFDSAGKAGEQQALSVCIAPNIPDNLNACNPQIKPPAAIVSLTWDSNADLDIVMHTPSGAIVDSKHPTTATSDSGSVPAQFLPSADPTTGYIDQDSNADCVEDNERREDIIWQSAPSSGTFLFYVSEFSACSTASSTFKITTYRQKAGADGTYSLVQTGVESGALLATQADADVGPALYVTSISFP
jgi:hypothetical protein